MLNFGGEYVFVFSTKQANLRECDVQYERWQLQPICAWLTGCLSVARHQTSQNRKGTFPKRPSNPCVSSRMCSSQTPFTFSETKKQRVCLVCIYIHLYLYVYRYLDIYYVTCMLLFHPFLLRIIPINQPWSQCCACSVAKQTGWKNRTQIQGPVSESFPMQSPIAQSSALVREAVPPISWICGFILRDTLPTGDS